MVFDVPSRDVRGEHAHRTLHQFLVCVHGECHLIVDDGRKKEEIVMNSPEIGVHVPPLVWAIQYRHAADAVLLVMASARRTTPAITSATTTNSRVLLTRATLKLRLHP